METLRQPATVVEKITFFNCAYSAADKVSECGGLADEGGDMKPAAAGRSDSCCRRHHRRQDGRSYPISERSNSRQTAGLKISAIHRAVKLIKRDQSGA